MGNTTTSNPRHTLRLQKIHIRNFKAIEDLSLNFPSPRMTGDLDVFLMGSKNGLGKTSVLESCALLFFASAVGEKNLFRMDRPSRELYNFPDMMVRAGKKETTIEGTFEIGNKNVNASIRVARSGEIHVRGGTSELRELTERTNRLPWDFPELREIFYYSLMGLDSEPLIIPPFIYFHSYRRVQEGSPELGMVVESERYMLRRRRRGYEEPPISRLKVEILKSLMGRGGLFENFDAEEADRTLEALNRLVSDYADGHIQKLRPSAENTIEFRVEPNDGGPSFSFDGLSSGQKEIISTLFLIWKYTHTQSGIILIDEPELHLNPEWHKQFIRGLHAIAPGNQYILATHSEDMFGSVEADRRLLLVKDKGGPNGKN